MSKVAIDSSLLEELGVKDWRMHTQFNHSNLAENTSDTVQNDSETEVVDSDSVLHVASEAADYHADKSQVEESQVGVSDDLLTSLATEKVALVFVGEGLEQVWQNDETPTWGLMLNILDALNIHQEEVVYFDTALLHTEDAIMMTIEEIIETGVEQVFSFDEESMLNEALAEGLHVEVLPSLDEMLAQGFAKKQVYYRLANYGH
ncbi:hypothetical protein [Hydrogenovibrio kuenenii]|uniref:hypothetical protein n=1 Tax=Hydrogenovibrio kuenenii TaxID=63658 RepID=UPI0004644D63|nr:hypothetical protein [Hydrogenovibrio kuenenii]